MTQRISRRKAMSLIGGGALAAAFPAVTLRAQGSGPLHLGVQTTIWGAVALVAEAEKTFAKAGADVVVDKFDSGANARDAMIGGHVDCVSIGATPFVTGVARSDLVAIGMVAYAGGTLALVGNKDIKTVPDLRGKKIASQVGSSTDYVFQNKIMPDFGLKKGDYQVVNVKFRDHVSAMASGSVDAFAGVEPYPSVAALNGLGNVITDYTKYDIVPVILGTNNTVLKNRPDDLVKFMRGWVAASDLCRNEPEKAAHILGNFFRAKGYKMKDDIFKLALSHMDVTPTFKPELKSYLVGVADTMVGRGQLSQAPDFDNALNRSILKKVGVA